MIETKKYKKMLEDELDLLKEELAVVSLENVKDESDPIPAPVPASSDIMDDEEKTMRLIRNTAITDSLEIRLKNIMRALDKIENNNYGMCELSKEPIEIERLDANPAARTNIANLSRETELED